MYLGNSQSSLSTGMTLITTEIVFTVNYTVIVSFSFAHMLLVQLGESDLSVS